MNRLVRTGWLLATSIGVMIHELAHKEAAEEFGIPVTDVCYFQMGDPAGYVNHAQPTGYIPTMGISLAPFLLNSGVAYTAFVFGAGYLTSRSVTEATPSGLVICGIVLWIGIASGVHSFPSEKDVSNVLSKTRSKWYHPVAIVGFPFVLLFWIVAKLRPYGAHIAYTLAVGYAGYRSLAFLPVATLLG